ncbi:type IV pilin protein [Candidatus Auribacterota bacterium]
MMKFNVNKKGFTLVEIMIVVAIIAVLVAISIPNFVRSRVSAREKACHNNLRQIHQAGEQYILSNSVGTFNYADLIGETNHLVVAPTCPTDGSAYTVSVASQVINVTCGSGEHGSYNGSFNS